MRILRARARGLWFYCRLAGAECHAEPPLPVWHDLVGGRLSVCVTLADIEAARRVIAGAVVRTPLLPAPKLSALTGADVRVKYENLQVTNSFKDRGAMVKLSALSAVDRARGVIAMSAGNHAQAVAYHA
ncbi:MAG: pyridoxal-phosphate dependent enzyme, partial [Proteobacteria bacterium]|nr:pyridoxal-phosphate dependent enzyme [Pseudomonadota bacterium]